MSTSSSGNASSSQGAQQQSKKNLASRAVSAFWTAPKSTSTSSPKDQSSTSPPRPGQIDSPNSAPILVDTLLGDTLECFSVNAFVNTRSMQEADEMESMLLKPFLALCKEEDNHQQKQPSIVTLGSSAKELDMQQGDFGIMNSTASSSNPITTTSTSTISPGSSIVTSTTSSSLHLWKTVKNKADVHLQRKKAFHDIYRAFVKINCDAARVFSILSNPAHLHQIDECYASSNVMKQFGKFWW